MESENDIFDRNVPFQRGEVWASAHVDLPGIVEIHLGSLRRAVKLTAAAAEDLAESLQLNARLARKWESPK
jgi:hypothetical protein